MRSITSVNFFSAHNWLRLCGPLHLLHELFPQCECWLCRSCMWKLWIKRVWNSHWFWADNYSNRMIKTYTFTYCYDSFLLVYSYVFIIPYYYFFFFFLLTVIFTCLHLLMYFTYLFLLLTVLLHTLYLFILTVIHF